MSTEFELVRVVGWSCPNNGFGVAELLHYQTEHEAWVDEQFILSNDLVTLAGVDATKAWFSVTPTSPYSSQPHQFTFLNQSSQASHLVSASHASLHRLADIVGDPQASVTIIDNMGRCGSTFVCQILGQVPGLRVMSEPHSLLHLGYWHSKGGLDMEESSRLLLSCLRLQCKPEHPPAQQIAIKLPGPCLALAGLVRTLLPSVRHIFLLRDPLAAIRSYTKAIAAVGQTELEFREFWAHCLPLPASGARRGYSEGILSGQLERSRVIALIVLVTLRAARDFVVEQEQESGFLDVFSYEELLENELAVDRLLALFQGEHQPKLVFDSSLTKVDSQASTIFAREALQKLRFEGHVEMEDMVRELGIPALTSSVKDFKDFIVSGKGGSS